MLYKKVIFNNMKLKGPVCGGGGGALEEKEKKLYEYLSKQLIVIYCQKHCFSLLAFVCLPLKFCC